MSLWMWIVVIAALVKFPIAALMLWIPFHNDEAMRAPEANDPSDEDGGSKTLPGAPTDPHPRNPLPRFPRRGPHGSPCPPAPRRIRTPAVGRRYVSLSR